ncbi:mycofactocin precursor MftA [Aciditerrimonas ferrireducens]|nr:mycofactocin precursor MftA [Aciditerrimonas ferrireducens]MCK4177962.1 mycofactocin precursor MftA [Aciditerrimonas ferrireducens]
MTILAGSGRDVEVPGGMVTGEAQRRAQLVDGEPVTSEDGELVVEELVVEELSIDGMCGVY